MEHVEYLYTFGMDEAELERHLREAETGVLSLARGDDAYAVPVGCHFDGDRLLLRLAAESGSEKMSFVEDTGRACFVVYEATTDESRSVLVAGELRATDVEFDETTINEWFAPLRVFDEAIDEVEPVVYELEMAEVTGRRT
ncbi:pyridoxamine 5'-phosphate oxidase family protein [halophilic archaeon]|nr:pyridoxamine 5'-phosphate oxidase family protein [halophilic archaeon]